MNILKILALTASFQDAENSFESDKPVWAQRRFLGKIIAVIAIIAGTYFQVTIDSKSQSDIVNQIMIIGPALGTIYGAILSTYGWIKNKQKQKQNNSTIVPIVSGDKK